MDSEELRDNKCVIVFYCTHHKDDPCVYFSVRNNKCKYENNRCECVSSVANINRMTLEIKSQKGE